MTNAIPVVIVGFYQDRIAGERLIKNLDSYEIPSYWADGRITGFPAIDNSNLSTDGFREIIQSYKRTKLIDIGLHGPGDLINLLLQTAGEDGFTHTFTMGCDEYLTGDWELLKSNLERIDPKVPTRFKVPIIEHNPEHNNNQKHIAERITFMPQYCRVKTIHWLYWSFYNGEDRMLGLEHNDPLVLGIDIHHDDIIRKPWRNQLMDKFQEQQSPRERKDLEKVIFDYFGQDINKRRTEGIKPKK